MQHPRDRWIQFHELSVESDPVQAPKIPFEQIATRLKKRVDAGECVKVVEAGTAAIRISKMVIDTKSRSAVMLLQYADTSVTDPSFLHLKKGKLRKEPKLEGEGVAVSAHILISLDSHDKLKTHYRVLLEDVPGLKRSKVSPFLRSEIKLVCDKDFEFEDELNNRKTRVYRPVAELLAIPSQALTKEIDAGLTVQGVEVIMKSPQGEALDEAGYYKVTSKKLIVTLEKKTGIKATLKRLARKAKSEGYSDLKLRYRSNVGKQRTAEFGSTQSDLVDVLVGKSEEIKSLEDLDQCMGKIVASIKKGMIKILEDSRA